MRNQNRTRKTNNTQGTNSMCDRSVNNNNDPFLPDVPLHQDPLLKPSTSHNLLFNFKMWGLAMINKERENFQYRGGDFVYIISPLTSQLRTNSQKIAVKYVGPVVVYKIIDPHNYLLMTLDGIILKGIFEHERLKPAIIRTSCGNVQNLAELKQVMNTELKLN